MNILVILVPLALALAGVFLGSFIFAARRGQFDDLQTPSYRILIDEEPNPKSPKDTTKGLLP